MIYFLKLWRLFVNLFAKKNPTVTNNSKKPFTREEAIKKAKLSESAKVYKRAEERLIYFDKIGYSQEKAYSKVPALYVDEEREYNEELKHTFSVEKHLYTMRRKLRALRLKGVVLPITRNKYGLQWPSIIR